MGLNSKANYPEKYNHMNPFTLLPLHKFLLNIINLPFNFFI